MEANQNNYFIQEHLQSGMVSHGGVGCSDAERILMELGFQPILFPHQNNFSITAKVRRMRALIQFVRSLPATSLVVFQAPLYARAHQHFVRLLRRFRPSVKVVCFITDIDGIRDGDAELLQKERAFFQLFDHFIVHNETMKNWLLEFRPSAKIGAHQLF
jgi:hypothetical protein